MTLFQFKKENRIDTNFLINGGTLFFIKFLHEHKNVIENYIKSGTQNSNIGVFFKKLKKLVQYDFKTNEYLQETNLNYMIDIINDIVYYKYGPNYDFKTIFEKNMSKDYLYLNFELWWYQSLFMVGGSGYIRNLNEYLKRYWDIKHDIFTEEECITKTKLIYNRQTVPRIFSNEELRKLENYSYFYNNEISLYETKYINTNSNLYYDGGRIF